MLTKLDFFYVQRQFVGIKPFVDVAKLAIEVTVDLPGPNFANFVFFAPDIAETLI